MLQKSLPKQLKIHTQACFGFCYLGFTHNYIAYYVINPVIHEKRKREGENWMGAAECEMIT